MIRCRYICRNNERCTAEVASETAPIMLCIRHLARALESVDLPTRASDAAVVRAKSHEPIVYYLRLGNRIKIGTTTNLARRLQVVPSEEVMVTEAGDWRLERQRHREFAGCRLTGEWFDGTDSGLLDHIDQVRRRQARARHAERLR